MKSLNLGPYLFGTGATASNQSKAPGMFTTTSTPSSTPGYTNWFPMGNSSTFSSLSSGSMTTNMNAGQWGSAIKRIMTYLFAVLIVIGILLLFVHFFIRPVFRWRPGTPGWITLPGRDDGVLFWKNGTTGDLLNQVLPIQNQYDGYTLQLDLFLQNPFQFSTRPRLLLTRGGIRKSTPSGDMLLGLLDQYNLAIALKPDTNDLLVSVLDKNKQMRVAVIPNAPVQVPFRLTVVVMERALEVYVNAQLQKTVAYDVPLLDVKGDISPASGAEANIARYRNLKIWPRILTTPEIKEATPPLSTTADMNPTPLPSSATSSCPASSPSV